MKNSNEPLFTVFRDKKPLMSTNSEECIPTTQELKEMKKMGYHFKDNRKKKTERSL